MESPRITMAETAEILHISQSMLMRWLQQTDANGRPICPFGCYVRLDGNRKGHYIIIRARLEKYLSGADMGESA